ncbi:M50 family metallopeptidase [Cryobacterium sp. GrIS_2_6]|uniref:M50 family metallopeptidase n=1 Tax=Cryobacterium sp. GrIS_2_6 TaxID=3162785 RepID=UPI002E04E0E5|nr:hypothetical protein [Cryobacterium psychrotolerans]
MDLLLGFWERVTARNDVLPLIPAWLAIAAAAAIVLVPVLWRACRNVVTIAHEGGHALVATLGGRQLDGIRLHSDTSGLTVSRGKPRGLGMVLTLLAGYSSPALLGLGAAWLLSLGYSVGLLWLLLAALALLLIQVRNWFGLWSVLATATVIFAVTWFGSAFMQSVFALLVTAFLLLGAVRTVLELQGSRSRRGGTASDADQLARLTHVPGLLWVGVFLIITIACAVLGAGLVGMAG